MIQSNESKLGGAEEFEGLNHFFNLEGFIRTLIEEPAYVPRKLADQIVLVRTGGSTSAYLYDTINTTWRRVTLT
ncbi:MAG: hypothetical protein UT51_C0009G0006 [Candidatus Nomurabacteria bacterium GW2011_GWC2_39_41]|uniref:Uncharacterized protein n=1 Tax=Candidatus Nomurabacteria bacterium GW2011_GWC2_39_41 TaxID=1618754 RepID=A0A837HUY9_9BACT|nr:MAG: hypothetical protein UT51_C0009G0006 [Candidatus Nomurabacteria bacterium GW2011_GWC2_39_41]KKR39253.1 MAG: hypothetical protein UT74_C0015G0004 [Parcubacteria group bacterium GW2011_GWC1_40_11]